VGVGLVLLALIIAGAVLSIVGRFTGVVPGIVEVLAMFNFLMSFGVITLLFALIFKIFAGATATWGDVCVGAALTSLLFTIGKLLIGLYLSSGRMRSAYGAAGSVIVLLFWFYISAQVFLFGAEFTRVLKNYRAQRRSGRTDAAR
jgi:membrane protein